MSYQLIKRTFEAKNFPELSREREMLNESGVTSEYMPSYKYIVRVPFFMSDGTLHSQIWNDRDYRTKTEALAEARFRGFGERVTFEVVDGKIVEHPAT